MKNIIGISVSLIVFFSATGCKDKTDKIPPPPPLVKKEKGPGSDKLQKGPIINVADTVEQKRFVLCIKDSSSTSAGMSIKLSNIYNKKLPDAIKAAKLKITGQPIAWYKTQKAPFFFEAGIPIDKIPSKIIKGIYVKHTGVDSALVAHFFGPNELSTAGYDALNEVLKERHKKKAAPAYEIYVQNPFDQTKGKRDPYKMQTDIIIPYK